MRLFFPFLALLMLAGCSSTLPVAPGRTAVGGDTLTTAGLSKKIAGRSVTIYQRDGRTLAGQIVAVTDEQCFFSVEGRDSSQGLPFARIARFERKDHIAGGISGFLLGWSGGLLVGGGVGSLIAADHGHGEYGGFGILVVAGLGSLVGGTAGAVAGAITGNSFNYDVVGDNSDPKTGSVDSTSVR